MHAYTQYIPQPCMYIHLYTCVYMHLCLYTNVYMHCVLMYAFLFVYTFAKMYDFLE